MVLFVPGLGRNRRFCTRMPYHTRCFPFLSLRRVKPAVTLSHTLCLQYWSIHRVFLVLYLRHNGCQHLNVTDFFVIPTCSLSLTFISHQHTPALVQHPLPRQRHVRFGFSRRQALTSPKRYQPSQTRLLDNATPRKLRTIYSSISLYCQP